ncbi:phosphodiesterase/alkaline phosphatase D [Burkholderiales bacterium JOSHI_001]|nr:phosphodiesterase/alkaline phosphatase D [Burkholderiales bacterium JOSHI_001]
MSKLVLPTRRGLLQAAGATVASTALPGWSLAQGAPAVIASDADRPQALQGLQFGDPTADAVMVWSRADRPARMIVEWSLDEQMRNAQRIVGPFALEASDFTARQDLAGLPAGREVFVRVSFAGLDNARSLSAPLLGRFTTPQTAREGHHGRHGRTDLRFQWGGDTAGQGWGINTAFGGMKIYEAMRLREPQFFIHSGDNIYADGPIRESVVAENGQLWTNIVTPEVAKVAETQDEFRGRYRYNLLDENLRRFNAQVPQIWQWDDHEVSNNWNDAKDLSADARYTEKNVPLLTARGARAFMEYAPMRPFDARESQRVYRRFSYGPLLEVFVLDMRSYRGPNTDNLQTQPGADTAFLGAEQLDWLKAGLAHSRATWKVVAADMPIGLNVGDGRDSAGNARWEAVANGEPGAPKGRELEFAELFSFLKRQRVRNVVWLTADVHYCAAHFYDPTQAAFKDFDGFWEFVSGPLNAGSFGPNALDATFGPQVVFFKAPPAGQVNLSPYAGLQFFGEVNIDARSAELTVDLRDLGGESVFSKTLVPRG